MIESLKSKIEEEDASEKLCEEEIDEEEENDEDGDENEGKGKDESNSPVETRKRAKVVDDLESKK